MRPADEHQLVLAAPLGEELGQPGGAAVEHDLNLVGHAAAHFVPGFVGELQGIEGHGAAELDQLPQHVVGARIARAQPAMRNAVVDEEHALAAVAGPQGRHVGGGRELAAEPLGVPPHEDRLLFGHEAAGGRSRSGAAELVVQEVHRRMIDHAAALAPQLHAVINVLVIGGEELLVETALGQEQLAGRHEEGPRAEVNVAAIHVGRGVGVVAAPVGGGRAVLPDDVAGLLQPAVEHDDAPAHRAHVVVLVEEAGGHAETVAEHLRVVVQQEQVLAGGGGGRLVHGGAKAFVLRVAQHLHAVEPLQEPRRLVARGVVNEDDFQRGKRAIFRCCADWCRERPPYRSPNPERHGGRSQTPERHGGRSLQIRAISSRPASARPYCAAPTAPRFWAARAGHLQPRAGSEEGLQGSAGRSGVGLLGVGRRRGRRLVRGQRGKARRLAGPHRYSATWAIDAPQAAMPQVMEETANEPLLLCQPSVLRQAGLGDVNVKSPSPSGSHQGRQRSPSPSGSHPQAGTRG